MLTTPCILYKATILRDAAGQQITQYVEDRTIDAFIAYANKVALPQNPKFENCTYVAITLNQSSLFQKQDKLNDYVITDIVSNNRFTFLLLED